MFPRPPISTPTDTLFPYPTLFRAVAGRGQAGDRRQGQGSQGDEEGRGAQEVGRMSLDNRTALFRMPIALRWRDLDAFNHVNNSTFMTYLEEARIRWFESLDERSEEHTSELQSLMRISYAVFCLKKKKNEQV